MLNPELVQSYVTLDRTTFCVLKLEHEGLLQSILAGTTGQIKSRNGWADLIGLCDEGCEEEELFWLLTGCRVQPDVRTVQRLFGRSPQVLNRDLARLLKCIRLLRGVVGTYAGSLATMAHLDPRPVSTTLQTLVNLFDAMKREFKNAQWFLSVAKVRLTDHVTYKSRTHEPHDGLVSGVIAAVTGKDYGEGAHRRFRNNPRYHSLFARRDTDPQGVAAIDPYTVRTEAQRQDIRTAFRDGISEYPEIRQAVTAQIELYERLIGRDIL